MQSTESAIISSYPTSVSEIIVLLNTNPCRHGDCIPLLTVSNAEFAISFNIWTNYRIYGLSRQPIRLLETQYPVFDV